MESLLSANPPSTMFLIAVPSIRDPQDWVPVRSLFDREMAMTVYRQMAVGGRVQIYEVPLGTPALVEVPQPVDDEGADEEE